MHLEMVLTKVFVFFRSLPDTYTEGFHDVEDLKRMPYRSLGITGLRVSALSFGASSLGSVFRATDDAESAQVLTHAIKSGINYVDTAPWYGHGKSETVLGKNLPSIPRSSYYLATKVGRYLPEVDKMFDFSAERTLRSVDESLARLNVDYVDIIQADSRRLPNYETVYLKAIYSVLYDSGLKTVLERSSVKIDAILTYCRGSMNDNSLKDWLPYFKDKGVGVVNASPISMGLLTSRGPPQWHPAKPHIKEACANAASYCKEQGVDISRLGLRFTLDQEDIPTTLVSTASLENLKKNLQCVYDPLTEQEQQVLQDVMSKFMSPLNNANWEGVELANYKKELAESQK
ncbi:L-galactose dehydrogenase [Aplysia californica]|uniref:L-galactose dehydrogenase n=1 Tax=Aplysia californica TaxID=6500 RepID=A0ABM0ZVY0_APLCA|nr:L-galactose dehydrogenase [Aplysia californica]